MTIDVEGVVMFITSAHKAVASIVAAAVTDSFLVILSVVAYCCFF